MMAAAAKNKSMDVHNKYMSKAQSEIISSLLIIIIATGLVSTAYIWGVPLIQKQQDTALLGRVYDSFNPSNTNSLPRRMQYVANFGGEELYTAPTDGVWNLNATDNSLQFSFTSKVSNFANFSQAEWISLTTGADCNALQPGTLGMDPSYVVCASSYDQPGGRFLITYKVLFRNLTDTSSGRDYRMDLEQAGSNTSSQKSIRISKGATSPDGTVTWLKVLLQ